MPLNSIAIQTHASIIKSSQVVSTAHYKYYPNSMLLNFSVQTANPSWLSHQAPNISLLSPATIPSLDETIDWNCRNDDMYWLEVIFSVANVIKSNGIIDFIKIDFFLPHQTLDSWENKKVFVKRVASMNDSKINGVKKVCSDSIAAPFPGLLQYLVENVTKTK